MYGEAGLSDMNSRVKWRAFQQFQEPKFFKKAMARLGHAARISCFYLLRIASPSNSLPQVHPKNFQICIFFFMKPKVANSKSALLFKCFRALR